MSTGKIITFYSYKGGTGRTMAMANVAWILASNGYKVLAIDWDLEAPGLHRYYHPFLQDKKLQYSEGVMDFINEFTMAAMRPSGKEEDHDWYKPYANLMMYAMSLDYDFENEGQLDLIPAGRQDSSYSSMVSTFNWKNFYDKFGGGVMLEEAKNILRENYDYVLVDSRTGISDTSGICTVQMPETLVVCSTLNNQGIEGASAVAKSVHEQWEGSDLKGNRNLRIFPVLTRVDYAEKDKLDNARSYAHAKFDRVIGHLTDKDIYWGQIEMPYVPYYAYEEVLAVFSDRPNSTGSLLASCESLTRFITDFEVSSMATMDESRRSEILSKYSRSSNEQYSVFVSYHKDDQSVVMPMIQQLEEEGVSVWYDEKLSANKPWGKEIEQQVKNCKVFIPVISGSSISGESKWIEKEWKLAESRRLFIEDADQSHSFIMPMTSSYELMHDDRVPESFRNLRTIQLDGYSASDAISSILDNLDN